MNQGGMERITPHAISIPRMLQMTREIPPRHNTPVFHRIHIDRTNKLL